MKHNLKLAIILLFFLLPLSVSAANSSAQNPCTTDINGNTSIEEFFDFLKNENVQNSVDFFEKVRTHKCYSGLLQNPVLNPLSFALHKEFVSPKFPRILLHNRGLTMMLVGDPTEPSSNILEIITLDSVSKKFLFSLVNFNAIPERKFTRNAGDYENDDFTMYKDDPAFQGVLHCAFCHNEGAGSESHPRWGLGPIFQAPFGQSNETIFSGSKQMAKWNEFQKTFNDPKLGQLYRYLNIETKVQADGTIFFPQKPNASLGNAIEKQNIVRVGRILRSAGNYSRYQFALVAILMGARDIQSYFSSAAWNRQIDAFKSTLRSNGLPNQKLIKDLNDSNKNPVGAIEENIAAFNFQSVDTILTRAAPNSSSSETFDLLGLILDGKVLADIPKEETISFILADQNTNTQKLALVRLLFEDSVDEKPVSWSTHAPFPFGESYRFSADFLDTVLRKEIGPLFLNDNPTLHLFSNSEVTAKNLKIPLSQFLSKLKALSIKMNP